jgi:hemoglobin
MRALLALALALAGACWTGPVQQPPPPATRPPPSAPSRSLYERLGGRDAIEVIVDAALSNIAADPRINTFFANTDLPALRTHLVDWVCYASGGDCHDTGKAMRGAHLGMGIRGEDFEAFVEAFATALARFRVEGREKGDLVMLLRRARPEIVER